MDGWHAANALGFRAQNWRFEPTYTLSISILSKHKHTQTHIHTYMLVPNRIGFVKCGER